MISKLLEHGANIHSQNAAGKTPAEVLGDEADVFLQERDCFVHWERRKTLVCFFQASSLLNSRTLPKFEDDIKYSAMVKALGMEEILRNIIMHL